MSVLNWSDGMSPVGKAVVAIGVFDGVHRGHQALLAQAVSHARSRYAKAVAITFDRDPDQVVTPEAAAPQLLTLPDKCRFILECGIDVALVVPFDAQIAAMEPAVFLDRVLAKCCSVLEVHVGSDFRFGARAAGDVDTLYDWAITNDAEIFPHELLEVDHEPVTSTRIRRLVADGLTAEAMQLLGRPTRITGTVHEGRKQGAVLGFPTANMVPVPFAAVPGDGVYAGRAILEDGRAFLSAISIGVPPMFPQAKDHVEAHLMDFAGDLYGRSLTLEFVRKLRDQTAFASLDELSEAISADVDEARRLLTSPRAIFGECSDADCISDDDFLEDGTPVVSDPLALAAAERAVANIDPKAGYSRTEEEWVPLVDPRRLSGVFADAGFTAAIVTAPLEQHGIPFVWDPYPPEQMPAFRFAYGAVDRPFTLMVPKSRLAEAQRIFDLIR